MKNIKKNIRTPIEEETDLSDFELFKSLTEQELIHLNLDKTCQVYPRRSIIYHEGHRLKGFYCITSGIIKLFKTGKDGKKQILRFTQKGDIIGYRSMIVREPACNTAEVMEEAVLCHIPYQTFLTLMQNNWQFVQYMLRMACKELFEANNHLISMAQKKNREHFAEVLLSLKQNFDIHHTDMLQVPLSRSELAEVTGTASESIIRMIKEFKQKKLIEESKHKIKYLNIEGLKKVANRMDIDRASTESDKI